MSMILGVQPDVPTETNERGGKQSATPYAFHFLPPHAIFATAEVAKYGARNMVKRSWIAITKKSPPMST